MSESTWKMVLYFDDQSPSYAHGFEAGQFWAEMKHGEPWIERTVVEEVLPMVRRMADYHYYHMDTTQLENGWVAVQLAKTPDDPVKRRLSVIDGGLAARPGDEAP